MGLVYHQDFTGLSARNSVPWGGRRVVIWKCYSKHPAQLEALRPAIWNWWCYPWEAPRLSVSLGVEAGGQRASQKCNGEIWNTFLFSQEQFGSWNQFFVIWLHSWVWLFTTPWTTACRALLSSTVSCQIINLPSGLVSTWRIATLLVVGDRKESPMDTQTCKLDKS